MARSGLKPSVQIMGTILGVALQKNPVILSKKLTRLHKCREIEYKWGERFLFNIIIHVQPTMQSLSSGGR
jgi:hypothetical protein